MEIVNFTPMPALGGGILIGLAAGLLLLTIGRVFGITGIISGIFNPVKGDVLWRFIVLLGLIGGAFIGTKVMGTDTALQLRSTPFLIVGGFLMGFGARYGSGCTSGHGVCGISRFSMRSILGTMTFMATGFVTVAIMTHLGLK
ncbi:MAG: YeeE/YedE family protein [Deltaproteobacteria bacterium]|nr:MAG: YeeE/YedE family protein [Deltaproteobacteria bacterium]TNF27741.1 MAG: YeeE/YedE family protein [Deltaproteobacteria bacterium]